MKLQLSACAVVGKFSEPRVIETVTALLAHLRQRGLGALVVSEEDEVRLPGDYPAATRSELAGRVQLLVSVGGDGTLLQAARLAAELDIPILGINRGRLGFLTDVSPQDIAASIDAIVEGQLAADRRLLLQAKLQRADGSAEQQLALNDVVLLRRETGRLLDFETHVDGRYVNSHSGDGLVISTATGSTAYALSCGGPIVHPRLNVIVMAPVCPHTMSDRPIVVPGDAVINVALVERGEGRAEVTCDATRLGDMAPGDTLEIMASGSSVTLLHPPDYDYFRLLRSKLHWGRGAELRER